MWWTIGSWRDMAAAIGGQMQVQSLFSLSGNLKSASLLRTAKAKARSFFQNESPRRRCVSVLACAHRVLSHTHYCVLLNAIPFYISRQHYPVPIISPWTSPPCPLSTHNLCRLHPDLSSLRTHLVLSVLHSGKLPWLHPSPSPNSSLACPGDLIHLLSRSLWVCHPHSHPKLEHCRCSSVMWT